MKWLFRPSVWLVVSAALVAAAALAYRIDPSVRRPEPAPVGANEAEIAWLFPVTSSGTWDRFVEAVQRLEPVTPGLKISVENAFPRQTASIPEVTLQLPRNGRTLVFRWYKVSSDWTLEHWVRELLARQPRPLAVVSGNSSYWAREVAARLREAADRLDEADRDEAPALLLTTATADFVREPEGSPPGRFPTRDLPEESGGPLVTLLSGFEPAGETRYVGLHEIYPGRTFRFCFTNRQMATAISRFLWSRNDLRPDRDPLYIVGWTDDAYSRDLVVGYYRALGRRAAEAAAADWAWATSPRFFSGLPGLTGPFPRMVAQGQATAFRLEQPVVMAVQSSVGSFSSANPSEALESRRLLDEAMRHLSNGEGRQRRPLLVVTGQAGPSRRFLRELVRNAPEAAQRFVVASGDAISFNTVYRDRRITWPIQDLPFSLVFFCHQNPIDSLSGFRAAVPQARESHSALQESGTEDLLLYRQILEALVRAEGHAGGPPRTGGELARLLGGLRLHDGQLGYSRGVELFSRTNPGQRQGGTGEHVVHVRPVIEAGRVKPEALLEVWAWGRDRPGNSEGLWQPRGELRASYEERFGEKERQP